MRRSQIAGQRFDGANIARYCSIMPIFRYLIVLILGIMVLSCSADQVILLDDDGSGEIEISMTLSAPFAAYITDLNASYGADDDVPLFDLAAIEESLASESDLTLLEASIPRREELYLLIGFDSIDRVLAGRSPDLRSAFRFERTESFRRVATRVNRVMIEEMLRIAAVDPFISDSILPPDTGMNATEYRDYLSWALEEYQQEQPLDRVFRAARVETRVIPAGRITQIRGGRRIGDAVVFETPLIEAITSDAPIEYSLVFQP